MLKTRRRQSDIHEIARFVAAVQVDNTRRLFEWQTAEKQIVDQAEDRSVRADRERERDHGDDSEPWRFRRLRRAHLKSEIIEIYRELIV